MDAHADHSSDILSADIHRQPIATVVEALHRVERDLAELVALPLKRANQARKETAEFNHKAAHVLAELGWTTCAIAGELAITQRRVQALIKQSCKALELELRVAREREELSARGANAPFFTEELLRGREPIRLDEALPTREKIKRLMQDGRVSQAEVARRLGISRQAVSKHVQALAVHKR